MAERTTELDAPVLTDETADALRTATDRAERAEAELARMKSQSGKGTAAGADLTAAGIAGGETAAAHVERASDLADARDSSASRQRAERAAHAPAADGSAVHTDDLKQPPSPSTAANAGESGADTPVAERGSAPRAETEIDGERELRKDPMMAHLLDSLKAGTDVGHYGRLVFSMVARHFLPHDQVVAWLTRDGDFSDEQAKVMLHQVEGRDYSPPRRERLLQWQREQEFQFMDVHDPDSGNLYRNLEFPKEIYEHIGHYQEAKAAE